MGSPTRRTVWRRQLGQAGPLAAAAIVALFCVIPFSWVVLASLDQRAQPYTQWPAVWTLTNFARILSDPSWLRLGFNSLVIAGLATILTVAAAALAAYPLSRASFPGRRLLLLSILLTRVIPASATIAPLYFVALHLGLTNSYHGLAVVEAGQQLPVILWMVKGFYDAIPRDIEEAAWIDGAGRMETIRVILFPLASPALAAAALFVFIGVWSDFLTPLVLLQSPDLFPLSIGLFRAYIGYNLVDWGQLAATALLYSVPAVGLYFAVRRQLLSATLAGGVTAQ